MKHLAYLLAIFPTLTFLPTLICSCSYSLSAKADAAPASVLSTAEVAKIGLQMVRSRAALDNPAAATVTSKISSKTSGVRKTFEISLPVTVADVMAGTRDLAVLAPATQNYVQNSFHDYAVYGVSSSQEDEKVLRVAAKTSLESIVHERQVRFRLRPFTEIFPVAFSKPDANGQVGSVGYGQSVNLDNPKS